jgi:predicted GNAT superfamily acetyltransferase
VRDHAALLALNNAHVQELSWLDAGSLADLLLLSWHARVAPPAQALLIALRHDAAYGGVNFGWFRARYPRFTYIDRVVVAAEARGLGLARALYEDVFARVAAEGGGPIGCEVNLDPPNPASDAFHAAMGFVEVGRATLSGGKVVRYYVR